jgi:chemotaxis protein methyltransferase CheR
MKMEAGLDQLAALIATRLGLGAQNLRRERLQEALRHLTSSADEAEAVAELARLDFRSAPWQTMITAATVPETRFLRQRGWFRQIELAALGPLIKQRRQQGNRRLRLWSAGCASGEEPYTLAMLLRDLIPDAADWRIEILATDINTGALRDAARGIYGARQLRELDPVEIARHFEASGTNRYAVRSELRSMIRFEPFNLADDFTHPTIGGPFDLVLCRNVLIYLTPDTQRRVAAGLCASLSRDGWLAVAPAEAMVDWFHPLAPVNLPEAILFSKQGGVEKQKTPPSFDPLPAIGRAAPAPVPAVPVPVVPVASLPRVAPASLAEGRRLADRGALSEARACCNELLSVDALNGDAYLLLSAVCAELGDLATAHDAARRAIYLTPTSAEAHFQLAGVLRGLGRFARAERTMETASRLALARAAQAAQDGMTTEIGVTDVGNR